MFYLALYIYRVTFIILTDSSAANLSDTLVVIGFDFEIVHLGIVKILQLEVNSSDLHVEIVFAVGLAFLLGKGVKLFLQMLLDESIEFLLGLLVAVVSLFRPSLVAILVLGLVAITLRGFETFGLFLKSVAVIRRSDCSFRGGDRRESRMLRLDFVFSERALSSFFKCFLTRALSSFGLRQPFFRWK